MRFMRSRNLLHHLALLLLEVALVAQVALLHLLELGLQLVLLLPDLVRREQGALLVEVFLLLLEVLLLLVQLLLLLIEDLLQRRPGLATVLGLGDRPLHVHVADLQILGAGQARGHEGEQHSEREQRLIGVSRLSGFDAILGDYSSLPIVNSKM
jgi:hypothetical protein